MKKLIIILTCWDVHLYYYDGGMTVKTANKNHTVYNSQFNHGYGGGGPQTLMLALMDMLYEDSAEVQHARRHTGIFKFPGFTIIDKIVREWEISHEPYPHILTIEVNEEMESIFPLLQSGTSTMRFISERIQSLGTTSFIGFFKRRRQIRTMYILYAPASLQEILLHVLYFVIHIGNITE